jgi:hypothetical protein
MANTAISVFMFLGMQAYACCAFQVQPFALKLSRLDSNLAHVPLKRIDFQNAFQNQQRRPNVGLVSMQQQPGSKSSIKITNLLSAMSIWGATIQTAAAKDGAFGVLETSWAGLLHPVGMVLLYGLTVAAGYHGLQWRRSRTIGQDIKELKDRGGPEADVKALQQVRSGEELCTRRRVYLQIPTFSCLSC